MRTRATRAGRKVREHASRMQLPIVAMCIATGLCVAYTSVNSSMAADPPRQSVITAGFCLIACGLYITLMVLSRVIWLILSYIEERAQQSYYAVGEEGADDQEYDSLLLDAIDGDEEKKSRGPGYPFAQLMRTVDPASAAQMTRAELRTEALLVTVHRDTVITSMYLGGCGAFTALIPLCMWDLTVTAMFCLAMMWISLVTENDKVAEFAPNVDRAKAVRWLDRLRYYLVGSVVATLVSVIWVDCRARMYSGELTMEVLSAAVKAAYYANTTTSTPVLLQAVRSEKTPQWPMLLLAVASPFALRIASMPDRTTRAERLASVLMTPSQTLEAALPVSTVLSILVLCWYSPVDALIAKDMDIHHFAVVMCVLCPPALATMLGLILRSFRHRQTHLAAAILTCACTLKLACTTHDPNTACGAVVATCQIMLSACTLIVYRNSVVAKPRSREKEMNDVVVEPQENTDISELDEPRLSAPAGISSGTEYLCSTRHE